MRKLFAAGLVALVGALLAYGVVGSGAWFTDQETVAVSAASGRIDIQVNGDAKPFSLTNVLPGVYDNKKKISVFNTPSSTVPVKFRFTAAQTGGSGPLWDQLTVKIRSGNCVNNSDGHDNSLGTVYEGLVKNLALASGPTTAIFQPLPVNFSDCYSLEFKLPDLAGNSLQNLTTNFNLFVSATQVQNPGWAENGT